MKNPINKSNIRRSLKLLLLLIILFITSNLFISSLSQFYIINMEINNIGKYYRSIGTIYPIGFPASGNYFVDEALEFLSGDPMIEFEDIRRHTIGSIKGFYNVIKEDIDFINQNIISYKVIGTKDMTALPAVQDSTKDFHLLEGRWIDLEDNNNQNNVVVINDVMARINDISLGDRIEITMRDSEDRRAEILYTDKDRREWKTYHSETIPFEVVGIFRSNITPGVLYRDIYVPDSTIPQEFGYHNNKGADNMDRTFPYLYPFMYSFVLNNLEDESAFMEKYYNQLSDLGYELSFVTNNGEGFLESSNPIKRSSLISFILFSILLLLTQLFVVFIYVDGHIINYAIERILGISPKISWLHLMLPLILYGSIASVIGGYLGYNNAIEKLGELLSDLPQDILTAIDSSLDIEYFILFIIMSIIPFIAIGLLKIVQLKKLSVVDLINNYKRKKTKIDIEESEESSINYQPVEINNIQFELSEQLNINDGKKVLRRFSVTQILRSIVPSMLLILLAGIFVFSLLWMNYLIIRNNNLIDAAYKEIAITGDIQVSDTSNPLRVVNGIGPINGRHINNLFRTELVQDYISIADMSYEDLYILRNEESLKYEPGEKDKKHFITKEPNFRVYASNKPFNTDDRSIRISDLNIMDGYSLDDFYMEYTSDYSDYYNPKIINKRGEEGIPILVSNQAIEHFDLELGDEIFLDPGELFNRSLLLESYGTIVGTFKEISTGRRTSFGDIYHESEAFIYPISALEAMEKELHYAKLEFEFIPEKNKETMERKEEIKKMVSDYELNIYPTELKLWDEELINVVDPLEKNLSLLEVLYPVTFIVSILIAGILSFLMVLRRTLDVAILRVLGIKEKQVKFTLFRENFALTVLGITATSILAFAITSRTYPIPYMKYLYVIGGYLVGTIIGLVLAIHKVTNKKPLDLLQVKE